MRKALLSINPEYVEMIFSGVKKYELRKSQCRRPIDGIIVYCTAPVMKVVGEVDVLDILVDDPKRLWKQVKKASGVTREFYDSYYDGRKSAVAYELGDIHPFDEPKLLQDFGVSHAPQSFVYFESSD